MKEAGLDGGGCLLWKRLANKRQHPDQSVSLLQHSIMSLWRYLLLEMSSTLHGEMLSALDSHPQPLGQLPLVQKHPKKPLLTFETLLTKRPLFAFETLLRLDCPKASLDETSSNVLMRTLQLTQEIIKFSPVVLRESEFAVLARLAVL
nr:hypothetical protein CFP56_56063 [Quercus suber]